MQLLIQALVLLTGLRSTVHAQPDAPAFVSSKSCTIWIGLRPTTDGREGLVLNGRGDPIASLVVPTATRIRQATATHVWVTETDDDGLSSVVRYRLSGLSCPPPPC